MRYIDKRGLEFLLLLAFLFGVVATTTAQSAVPTSDESVSSATELPPTPTGLVITQTTEVLEPFESNPGMLSEPDEIEQPAGNEIARLQDGWVTIMSEDGEGAFPEDNGWIVVDQLADNGDDFWDDVTCRAYAGSSSIWAAGNGLQAGCSQYDNNMATWMVYGPFNLSGNVTDAKLDFYFWLDTEPNADIFNWLVSTNGRNFSGLGASGNSNGWIPRSFDLSAYVGTPTVWIAFKFDSGPSVNNYEGVYVDNIVLSKYVVDSLDPDIDITPTSMSFTRQATVSNAAVQASTVEATNYSQLSAKIRAEGQIPVIVRLKTDFAAQGPDRSPLAVGEQRYTIEQVQDQVLADLSGQNVEPVKRFNYTPHMALTVDAAGLDVLANSSDIDYIVEDVAVPPTLDLSVPLINADDVWAAGYEGTGQVVAILDTGVDSSHIFLIGKVVSEACYSTTNVQSTTVCPSGGTGEIGSGAGINCDPNISGCTHGTHVAGIAAGNGTNGITFDGVARDADIISIQVFSKFASASDCEPRTPPCVLSWTSDLMAGLERVYELRDSFSIAAVNLSLGGGSYLSACDSDPRKAAIDNLRSVGIATAISSGNNGSPGTITAPACISSAVSVGATTYDGSDEAVASYSNSASILDLLAPGSLINSSLPGGGFGLKSGTSMAAPHVAGAWAVLKSYNPDATVDEVLNALTSTGVPIEDSRNNLTKPRIDLEAALTFLSADDALTIRNTGYTDLNVTNIGVSEIVAAKVDCDWLRLDTPATPFTIEPGGSRKVGVNIDVCEPAGTYTTNIQITSNDPDEVTVNVPVTLNVAIPLAISVNWFLAEPVGDAVVFQWQTTTESGTAGFYILAQTADGTMAKLNDELIPSSVIDSVTPTRYSYSASTDATIFFLQEIGLDGAAVMHGPFDLLEPSGVFFPTDENSVQPALWLPMFIR